MKTITEICLEIKDGDWIESKDQSEDGIRLIQTGNIGNGKYLKKEARSKFISENTFKDLRCTEIYPGDILVSRLPSPVGRACIIPVMETRAITAVDCTIVRVNNKICNSKYFVYYTQSELYQKQINKHLVGTTRLRISRKNLESIKIPLPNLETQIKIADILDQAQELIDKRKAQIEALDELIQSVFYDMFGDINNPKNVDVVILGDYTKHVSSGSTPKGGQSAYLDTGIPLIRSQNVLMNKIRYEDVAYISSITHELMKRSQLMKGDVLLNITGASIGRVAVYQGNNFEANVNQHVCIIRLNNEFAPLFMSHMIAMNSFQQEIQRMNSGATREALNYSQIKQFKVLKPSLELQNQFVDIVENIEKQKELLNESLIELENNFNSLMQRVFKGELFQ